MKPRRFLSHVKMGKLYAMLIITVLFFLAEIAASYITHSLTLLVDAYHTLYNTMAIVSCIVTLKLCERPPSLSNTFGWARVEVLAMMADLLFLAALCFSLLVESVQTMVHAGHQDAMHYPVTVGALGLAGFLINFLCILLIGGYTHHQGSFLDMDPSGAVVVHTPPTEDAVRRGMRRLSVSSAVRGQKSLVNGSSLCPSLCSVFRDLTSCLLVMVVAGIVWMDEHSQVALYADPGLAITSVVILAISSYPYVIQAACILLQTIPGDIDVNEFKAKLTKQFPCLVDVHDLHIWALTSSRIIATAHLVFTDKQVYVQVAPEVESFFKEQGITQVTLQPEFPNVSETPELISKCAFSCQDASCLDHLCCKDSSLAKQGGAEVPDIQIGCPCPGHHAHTEASTVEELTSVVPNLSCENTEVQERLLPSAVA